MMLEQSLVACAPSIGQPKSRRALTGSRTRSSAKWHSSKSSDGILSASAVRNPVVCRRKRGTIPCVWVLTFTPTSEQWVVQSKTVEEGREQTGRTQSIPLSMEPHGEITLNGDKCNKRLNVRRNAYTSRARGASSLGKHDGRSKTCSMWTCKDLDAYRRISTISIAQSKNRPAQAQGGAPARSIGAFVVL